MIFNLPEGHIVQKLTLQKVTVLKHFNVQCSETLMFVALFFLTIVTCILEEKGRKFPVTVFLLCLVILAFRNTSNPANTVTLLC